MSINIKGNGTTFTTGENSPIIMNQLDSKPKQDKPFYKHWWFVSFIFGIIGFLASFFFTDSYIINSLFGIFVFLLVLVFNPERRFFRVGMLSFYSAVAMLLVPNIKGKIYIPQNEYIEGLFNLEKSTSYLAFGMFLALAFGMFLLDFLKERK